jgi:hypothetical protein
VSVACQSAIHPQLDGLYHPVVLIQDMVGSHWTPTTNLLQDIQAMMQTPCPDNIIMVLVVAGDPAIETLVVSAYKRLGPESCTYQSCSTTNQAIRVALEYLSQEDQNK